MKIERWRAYKRQVDIMKMGKRAYNVHRRCLCFTFDEAKMSRKQKSFILPYFVYSETFLIGETVDYE